MANLVDHVFHHLAGILDQVDDGKQDLSVGLAELLDNGGRLAGGASHDVVSFLHGGRLLSVFCVWQPDSIESVPTAAYQPSTRLDAFRKCCGGISRDANRKPGGYGSRQSLSIPRVSHRALLYTIGRGPDS